MTARENLLFFARLSQLDHAETRVEEALDYLDCKALTNRKVGEFSKGMRQRIGLVQAILQRPEVLFLDEPSSGLDPMGMSGERSRWRSGPSV